VEFKKFNFSPEEGFCDSTFYEDTPGNPREILQRQHNQTRDFINSLVDKLNNSNEGESGIEMIKSPPIEGVSGNNPYSQIKSIKTQLDSVALKEVPDHSIGEEKIKDNSISKEKIKDGEVTSEKLSPDTVAPFSEEALNLNSIPSEKFSPVFLSSSIGVYKECLGKADINYVLKGKNYGNKRYLNTDGTITSLNLENGDIETFAVISDITFKDFIVDEDERLYLFNSSYSSSKYRLWIYVYNPEYKICELYKTVDLNSVSSSGYEIYKADFNKDYIYILLAYRSTGTCHYYLYEIKRAELDNSDEVDSVGYTSFSDAREAFLGCNDNTVIFGNKAVVKRDFENVLKLDFTVKGISSGNVFSEGSSILVRDAKNFQPKLLVCDNLASFTGFLWKDFIYAYIGGYIAKGRIF